MSRLVESDLIATLSNQVTSLSSTVASLSATVTRQNDLIQKLLSQNTSKASTSANKTTSSNVDTPKPAAKRASKAKPAQSTPNPSSNPIPPSSAASGSGSECQAGPSRIWDSPGPPPPAYSSPLNAGTAGTKAKGAKSRSSAPSSTSVPTPSQGSNKTPRSQSMAPIPSMPTAPRSLHEAMSFAPPYSTAIPGIPSHMTLNSFTLSMASQPASQPFYPTPASSSSSRPLTQASRSSSQTSHPPPPTYHATPQSSPWASHATSQTSHPSNQPSYATQQASHLSPRISQAPPQASYPSSQTSQSQLQKSHFPTEKPSPPTSIPKSDSGSDYAPASTTSSTSSTAPVPPPPPTLPSPAIPPSAPPPVPTLASALAAMPTADDEASPLTISPLTAASREPKPKVKKVKEVLPKPPHASVPTINAAIPDPTGRPVFPMFGKRWLPCILTAWWFADPANGVPIPLREWDVETRLASRDKWKKAEWIARGWHILKGHYLTEHPEDQLEVIDLSQLDADVEAWEKRWGEKQNTALAVIRQAIRDDPANYTWAPVKFGEAKKRKLEEEAAAAAAAEAGLVEEDNREYRFIEYDPVKRIKGMWGDDLSTVGFGQLL